MNNESVFSNAPLNNNLLKVLLALHCYSHSFCSAYIIIALKVGVITEKSVMKNILMHFSSYFP